MGSPLEVSMDIDATLEDAVTHAQETHGAEHWLTKLLVLLKLERRLYSALVSADCRACLDAMRERLRTHEHSG
jgi:hypothetical protein